MIIKVLSAEGDPEYDLLFQARGMTKEEAIKTIDEAIRKVKAQGYGYVFEDLLEALPKNIVSLGLTRTTPVSGEVW